MFKRNLLLVLGLLLAWGVSPSANAAITLNLDTFTDLTTEPINLPATKLLMASVGTNAQGGGAASDATSTTVTIGGSVVAADIAQVCVDYNSTEVACVTDPGSLTSIVITLTGTHDLDAPFDYRVTLNPSAAGKTISLSVDGFTASGALADNIPLPASTATRNISGGGTPPTVTSPTFADVTDTTATLGGNVTDGGSPTVTDRGVEWGTTPGGPWPNSVAQGSGGTGVFTVPVTGLPPSSTIYFRAWADNGIRVFSAENSFVTNTPAVPPTVGSPTFASVTSNSAILGGTVSANGGATVTDRGVVWNTTSPAETGGTVVSMGSGLGTFSQLVGSLPAGTLIFFKAYATNSAGTSYSSPESSFSTLAGLPTVDTPTVTSITATSAVLGGNVSNDGGGTVSARGVVWDTVSPPEAAGTVVPMGSGTGVFSNTVGSLPTGTLVYFKAYATNETDTAYSTVATFTPSGPPVVDTPTVANITLNTADLGGNIASDGGATITERGIVWDTASPPETAGTVVPNWSGLNPFTATIDGLPTGTPIFFKAYAINASSTSYSAESSFSTLSEPTVQATNIAFPQVAGESMRITWTRGNGDGSIVVMRLGAPADPGIQAPADGDDYAANADFTLAPELPVNSQNFVVYKGSDSNIVVRGLLASTNYSVAIYEFGRIGANPDYLLTTPAAASQATTAVPVHNMDNGVDCSDCHAHGSWSPTRAELITACEVCHNSGAPEAPNKLMFDNHLTPSKNPAIDVVACGFCHELHNPNATDTTSSFNVVTGGTQLNKSFLRANVDKYVPTASPPAYLHTDQPLRETGNPNGDPDALALTPDRAVEGGTDVTATPDDTQATGYCQVCHTQTNYHRSTNLDGSIGPTLVASIQTHDGEANDSGLGSEVNCGTCHQHKDGFQGIGGSQTCIECHQSQQDPLPRPIITTQFDRLSTHIPGGSAVVTQPDCMVCHDQSGHPGDQIVGLRDLDPPGTALFEQPTAAAPTISTGEGEAFAGHCLSCHDDSSGADVLAGGDPDQTPQSPFTGSGAPPIIGTAWATAGHNRPDPSTSGGFSNPVTCLGDGANGCHASGHGTDSLSLLANAAEPNPAIGAAVNPTDFCFNCHDVDGPSSIDIVAQFNAGTAQQYVSGTDYTTVNKRHDVLSVDQAFSGATVSCKDCHSPHVDNATDPVADPDTSIPLPNYSSTGSYTDDGHTLSYNSGGDSDPTNPEGGGSVIEPDYIQFCLTCHDGTPPPGVIMPASILDIATLYTTDDQHGGLVGNGSASRGYLKYPWATLADEASGTQPGAYAAMNCTLCHGAHGSGNIYNLRTEINVAGVQMEVGGVDVFTGVSGTTYELPDGGSGQEKYGWAAWCTFCHEPSHDTKTGLGCNQGHRHGGGAF